MTGQDAARSTRSRRCPTPHKRKFTQRQAQLALIEATLRHNRGRRPDVERRAYECPCGRHWHLTSKPYRPSPRPAPPADTGASLDSSPTSTA